MKRFRKHLLFLADSVILIVVTLVLSQFSLRYQLGDAVGRGGMVLHMLILYFCTVMFQMLFHTYDSLWRYAESKEYTALLLAAFCGFFTYEVLTRFILDIGTIFFVLLTAIASLWVLGMLALRFSYRVYRSYVRRVARGSRIPVAVVGAGEAGIQLLNELRHNPDSRYEVQCFFDDDPAKVGRRIRGVEVKGRVSDIPARLKAMDIREVIVAIPSVTEERRQEILQTLAAIDRIHITVLPSALNLLDRQPIQSQLREVQIEDLLGREPVQLDPAPVNEFLGGKVVLVSGGGGSIGSELCRQIAKHHPKRLIIVDIYENNAYDIQQELIRCYGSELDLVVEIASIRDRRRVWQLMGAYCPDVIFHAAAHKHVPLMETSPQEAIRNNVFGTLNLVEAADYFGVKKFMEKVGPSVE